ncbi:MAG TPA: hypothetical protein VFC73_05625 [Syntrophomonadaceae bacterium]|nr:hypothetical protein [Syntrophomonadaceae bacterium]
MEVAYSLVGSYLLLGTAIGLIIWFTAARLYQNDELKPVSKKIILVAIVLAVAGVILAMLHLGKVERFFYLLLNPSSWLAREGLFAGAFTGGIILYFILIRNKVEQLEKFDILLYINVFTGFCTLVSMGMIYASASAVPAWNSIWSVLVNVSSGLLLGGLLFMFLIKEHFNFDYQKILGKGILVLAIVTLLINVANEVQVWMALSAIAAQGGEVPAILLSSLLHILVGFLVPLYLIILFIRQKETKPTIYLTVAFVFVILGEITGKIMHFIAGVKAPFI